VLAARDEGERRAAKAVAAEVPLGIAETAAAVAELARSLAAAGRPGLVGDALAGADIAAGAARAAARLVEINLADAPDDPRVARARAAVARAAGAG
jgi:formiminotetrahydrofolate cyclodeaminase